MENITIECPEDATMVEMVDKARKAWAEANIAHGETYLHFAKRVGVSYRTVLRWLGRLNATPRLVRRALTHVPIELKPATLPIPLVWAKHEIRAYRGPVAYLVMQDGCPMYAGSSKNGAARVLGSGGQHDRLAVILNASHIHFYPCETRRQAVLLETRLIEEYKPLFNVNRTRYKQG